MDERRPHSTDRFAKTPKLDSLWLDDNRLEQLPESIGLLKNKLTILSVARNPLTKNTRARARLEALLPKTKIYWR